MLLLARTKLAPEPRTRRYSWITRHLTPERTARYSSSSATLEYIFRARLWCHGRSNDLTSRESTGPTLGHRPTISPCDFWPPSRHIPIYSKHTRSHYHHRPRPTSPSRSYRRLGYTAPPGIFGVVTSFLACERLPARGISKSLLDRQGLRAHLTGLRHWCCDQSTPGS